MTLEVIYLVLWIIFSHWVADFVFQDEEWAKNKHKSLVALLNHTVMYSMIMALMMFIWVLCFDNLLLDIKMGSVLGFTGVTFVGHTLTDFFTSKIVSKKFKNKNYGSAVPNFGAFTIIGIDQVLHYAQLLFTYYLFFE